MLRLIYFSTAIDSFTQANAERLALEAAGNNVRDEVTGAIMFHDGHFLQVIEGPKAIVEDTFIRIMMDQRHHSFRLIARRLSTRREFGDFAMALCRTADEKHAVSEHILEHVADAPLDVQRELKVRFCSFLDHTAGSFPMPQNTRW